MGTKYTIEDDPLLGNPITPRALRSFEPKKYEPILGKPRMFCSFSLRVGSIFAASVIIVFSAVGLEQCAASLGFLPIVLSTSAMSDMVMFVLVMAVVVIHAVMMVLCFGIHCCGRIYFPDLFVHEYHAFDLSGLTLYGFAVLIKCAGAVGRLPSEVLDMSGVMVLYLPVQTLTMIYAVTLLLTIAMLVGALRRRVNLMRPWVSWMSFLVIMWILLYITFLIKDYNGELHHILISSETFTLVSICYMFRTGHNYYEQLLDVNGEKERLVNSKSWNSYYY